MGSLLYGDVSVMFARLCSGAGWCLSYSVETPQRQILLQRGSIIVSTVNGDLLKPVATDSASHKKTSFREAG